MRSKWLTLVFVGSLGLMGTLWWASGGASRAADDDRAPQLGDNDLRRQANELLRRANAELQANRFDAARRLAQQAADLHATFSLFDVRPEHVLAEIERRERSGDGPASPPPAPRGESQSPQPLAEPAPRPVQPPKSTTVADSPFALTDPFTRPKSWMPSAASPVDSPATDNEPSPATQKVPVAQSTPPPPRARALAAPTHEQQLKARAVTMLDRGLQALDEHRLDDAERYARAALSLHAQFDKLEYKPEYLITEIGIARARQRLETSTAPATASHTATSPPVTLPAQPTPAQLPPAPATTTQSLASQSPTAQSLAAQSLAEPSSAKSFGWNGSTAQLPATAAFAAALPQPASPGMMSSASGTRATNAPSAPASSATASSPPGPPSVATSEAAALADRQRAEQMLREAVDDLHAGRDDLARLRIQGALRVMHPNAPAPLPLPTVDRSASSEPEPGGPLPPQPGMPRAGFPTYVPNRVADNRDAILKPLHDPYFGDEPSTRKYSAAENSLRENFPEEVPLNPALSLDRPLPVMSTEVANPPIAGMNAPASSATRPATFSGGVTQTANSAQTGTPTQAAKVHWPESDPAPASQSGGSGAYGWNGVGSATAGPAPETSPSHAAPSASRWSSGSPTATQPSPGTTATNQSSSTARYPYTPPSAVPVSPASTDAPPQPGYFRRVWNSLIGD